MSTMKEIYKNYATAYDKLEIAEGQQNNFTEELLNIIDWNPIISFYMEKIMIGL